MRASSRPLAVLCPSSALPFDTKIEVAKEAADTGSAAHHLLAQYILGGDLISVENAARMYGVDADELSMLLEKGIRRWNVIIPQELETELHIEEQIECDGKTGKPDLWWEDAGDTFQIVDWKFGREMRDHYHQLAQYAWMLRWKLIEADCWGDESLVEASIEYVRLGKTESYLFSNKDLDEWFAFTLDRQRDAGKVYSPGDHCGFCPHAPTCHPRMSWSVAACDALAVYKPEPNELSIEVVGKFYDRYKQVKRAVADYERVLNGIIDSGSNIPLPGGYVLKREQQEVDDIDPKAAWPVLTEAGFSRDDIAGVLSMSKGAIERIVKDRAPKRQGAEAMRQLMAKLAEFGAVSKKIRNVRIEVKEEPNG